MSRIIGVNNLHIAEVLTDTASETTFGTPKRVPSLVSIEIADQKENVTFYSDDTIEQVIPAFSGKEVKIELGYLTHEIEAMITGNQYEEGVYIQKSDAIAKNYALLFKAPLSAGGNRYVCLYKGVLAKDETAYQGKGESIEPSNVTLSGVFMPLLSNGQAEIKVDDNDAKLNEKQQTMIKNWFTTVPVFAANSVAMSMKKN